MTYDVIILTDKNHVNSSENPSLQKIFLEDNLLKQALIAEGLSVERLSWDDAFFDWQQAKSVIFRSTWDYFNRFDEFTEWLNRVSKQTILFNSKDLIYWNIDKHYLKDLDTNGIRIVETHFIEQGSSMTLAALYEELGWKDTVLKPCVSGTSRHTYKLSVANLEKHEAIFKELISKESMMLSPFQHNIVTKGEMSLVIFNGIYSHAVLKVAKTGDFRVQSNFGGSVHAYDPTEKEIAFATKIVHACPELPIYARVDIFIDNDGELAVLEVELVEPELWFRNNLKAADILANALKEKLNAH